MRRSIPVGPRRARPDDRLSVVEHLDELRRRALISALALIVAFAGMYAMHDRLIELLVWPLPGDDRQLITLSPTEPFFTTLKISLWAAVLLALPVWLYQVYAFVIPAVADQPRRIMLAIVAAVAGLFAAGVAFGYVVVLPVALEFLDRLRRGHVQHPAARERVLRLRHHDAARVGPAVRGAGGDDRPRPHGASRAPPSTAATGGSPWWRSRPSRRSCPAATP